MRENQQLNFIKQRAKNGNFKEKLNIRATTYLFFPKSQCQFYMPLSYYLRNEQFLEDASCKLLYFSLFIQLTCFKLVQQYKKAFMHNMSAFQALDQILQYFSSGSVVRITNRQTDIPVSGFTLPIIVTESNEWIKYENYKVLF